MLGIVDESLSAQVGGVQASTVATVSGDDGRRSVRELWVAVEGGGSGPQLSSDFSTRVWHAEGHVPFRILMVRSVTCS